jgi:hypothetical protein
MPTGATTYSVTTSRTDINGVWRKVQHTLIQAARFLDPEWDDLEKLEDFSVDWSTREITAPLDLEDDVGIASIDEGGFEALPASTNPVDGVFTWITLNGRFTISRMARDIDQKNKAAMLANQLKYQGKKKLAAIGRRIADYFYGFSTATMAKVSGAVAAAQNVVVPIKDAYGIPGLGSTTAPYFVASLFRKGERIAFIRAGVLVESGKITAVNAGTPSLNVTLDSAVALNDGDIIVFANAMNVTAAAQTDLNKGLIGFLDAATSTSVHGVSGATYDKWNPGFVDTAAGRFTATTYRKMRQGIENNGGDDAKLTDIRWSQGVENDVVDQLRSGLRFNDAFGLEIDGSPKAKNVTLKSTRKVPPGFVFGYDRSGLNKMTLLERPGMPTWDDAEKIQNVAGFVFPLEYHCQMVWKSRGKLAYASNKTEA